VTELMEAHAHLSAILASYAVAWRLEAIQETSKATGLEEQMAYELADLDDSEVEGKAKIESKYQSEITMHLANADVLVRRAEMVVARDFLTITDEDRADPNLTELIAMAELAKRLKVIG
jgi:hypothetical protein